MPQIGAAIPPSFYRHWPMAGFAKPSGYHRYTGRNRGTRRREDQTMKTLLQTIAILGSATVAATAAEPGPACAPIMKAMAKTLVADHATVTQMEGRISNGITAGGVNYLQIDNVWKVSPLSPKDNQARSEENLRNAKAYSCQSLPDGSIDGVAVAIYRTRTETEDAVVESKISISKASGLAIEVENDLAGDSKKSHYSTRYSYSGVHAPIMQK